MAPSCHRVASNPARERVIHSRLRYPQLELVPGWTLQLRPVCCKMVPMTKIGRYQLGPRIGAGSFATVYRAEDPDLQVSVAIKVLAENWAGNQDVRERFLDEARMLRRFQDPRIVRVHDVGTTENDQPYFVMDYADAGSMEKLRKSPPPPGRALRLCAEAARGIEVMHRHNIIHRDITPGNILLAHSTQGIRVMLADLGVAKSLTERQEGTMTAGTPAFMAYEQATDGWLDQRVDIYSMAAVTYALLTGHPPFPIRTLNDLLTRDWSVGVTQIADSLGAPPELDDLLAASLSPIPQERPQSAEELALALDRIAGHLPGGESYLSNRADAITGFERQSGAGLMTQPGGATAVPQSPAAGGLRPLAPAPMEYDEHRQFDRAAFTSIPEWDTSLNSGGSWLGSLGDQAYRPSRDDSITPLRDTPETMLARYLDPKTDYKPDKVKERHNASTYLWLGLLAVAVVALTIWLTIQYLI